MTRDRNVGRSVVGSYPLVILALISVAIATFAIETALGRMQAASIEIAHRAKTREAAEQVLSLTIDSEIGQRGFLLTGNKEYLQPYLQARQRAPAAWKAFDAMELDPGQRVLREQIRKTFSAKFDHNARTIAQHDGALKSPALVAVESGVGRQSMDRMRLLVARFQAHEARGLATAERKSAAARTLATVLTMVSALAFAVSGALMYAAVRRSRADAGREAGRASTADQRFKATFDQSGIGFMHIDREGRPILVNDAMCEMTGFSREEFVTATPDSPAMPANLFSNKDRCDAILGGAVGSYRHERLTHTKDGKEIYLSSMVSAVRSETGEILFLSAVISNQTARYHAEKDLRDSQDRLRRLQDEFAHVARVNDLGEMAAAIAHEVNQPLTAISNYMSVANKLAAKLEEASDLPEILQRTSEQALRAGQIVKRMRGFVERTNDVREATQIGSLIDSAIEMTMIGSDRDAVNIARTGRGGDQLVRVDPIQFQQVLIILMRNAIEARAAASGAGKCEIEVCIDLNAVACSVVIDVSDNGPGLDAVAAADIFKPFVTSKPGNMGMGLSIARRLIDSHGGRLTLIEAGGPGATFRITIPLADDEPDQSA